MADTRTAEDRASAADVRAWAADNGLEVAESGRIPAAVRAAYEAARAQALSEGAALEGADFPEVTDDDPAADAAPAAGPPAGGPHPPAGDAPAADEPLPPPADLAEARARAGGRPRTPSWARRQASAPSREQKPAVKVTAAVRSDIEGKLALLLGIPAMTWATVDPYCGGAFADNLDNIVHKMVPLICQSPDAVKFLTKGTSFILLLDFIVALQPVGSAVWNHHIAHTVEIVPAGPDGQPLQQQAAQPDLSQYATVGHVPAAQPDPAPAHRGA